MKPHRIVGIVSAVAIAAMVVWAGAQPSRWQVIAAYRTSLESRTSAQAHNAELAANALDGKTLQPGAEFSFNRAVGSWTADKGYVKAPVSFDGELVPSWGGGVCQTSSTLYNAALLAGLDIIERHRHRFAARYVPPGQDSAVAQYDVDLRLRNPYPWPVKMQAEVSGKWLICRLLAQRKPDATFSVEREIRQITQPSEVVRASGGANLRWRVLNHGAPGIRVAVYRRETKGDQSVRRLLSDDTYPPLNRLVEGE